MYLISQRGKTMKGPVSIHKLKTKTKTSSTILIHLSVSPCGLEKFLPFSDPKVLKILGSEYVLFRLYWECKTPIFTMRLEAERNASPK